MVKRHMIASPCCRGTGSSEINRQTAGSGGRGGESGAFSGTRYRIACRQTPADGEGADVNRAESAGE